MTTPTTPQEDPMGVARTLALPTKKDPFGLFKACGVKPPPKRKKFDAYSIILAGSLVYVSSRYRLGNMYKSLSQANEIENDSHNIVIPVYAYIHGMVAQSTRSFIGRAHHADWDSGRSGFWFIARRDLTAMGLRITPSRKELLTLALDSILNAIHDDDTDQDDERVEWFRKDQ